MMHEPERRAGVPRFAWPLVALGFLVLAWIVQVIYLALDGDRRPTTAHLVGVRVVAGLLVITSVAVFVRDRRRDRRRAAVE